jgi:CheY-like chemotaxis protein
MEKKTSRVKNILFVDDEQSVLDGIQRNLRRTYSIHTANGAEEAFEVLEKEGPFAVIISDMHMPVMNGASLLSKVAQRWPDTVRAMLTGKGDIETAIAAINEGNIFRFAMKPFSKEQLTQMIEDCLEQHRLITAERDLLEGTLQGSVQVLIDMLSMTHPAAFSSARRVQYYTSILAKQLGITESWSLEVAAMLSYLGMVTIPVEIVEKYMDGVALAEHEQQMINTHPVTASRLISAIPRLEPVADMIARQARPFSMENPHQYSTSGQDRDALILHVATQFDRGIELGLTPEESAAKLNKFGLALGINSSQLFAGVCPPSEKTAKQTLRIDQARDGMTLAADIRMNNGTLVMRKGQTLTDVIRKRLLNYLAQGSIDDHIKVFNEPRTNS